MSAGGRAASRPGVLRSVRLAAGAVALGLAVGWLVAAVDTQVLRRAARDLVADPVALLGVLVLYAAAFALRAQAWSVVLPALSRSQAWAALHVSLLGNHVLPLRLGEPLRLLSAVRRSPAPGRDVVASGVVLRLGELASVVVLAAGLAPLVARGLDTSASDALPARWLTWSALAAAVVLVAAAVAGAVWLRRRAAASAALRPPGLGVAALLVLAWVAEAGVVWQAARAAGVDLSVAEAVAVTAVTVAAQTVALTPGGVGTYEAAGSAALVVLGVDPAAAVAVAVLAHAVKTAYSLLLGLPALLVPDPSMWGPLRLPGRLPPRPAPLPVAPDAPVVVVLPARDEEATVGEVVGRLPSAVRGRRVEVLVVDDGSTDATAARARAAAATVLDGGRRGLGAAVRLALAEAAAREPAAVVYLDADGEYPPDAVPDVAEPVLCGEADYVVASRFGGCVRDMRAHREAGNRLLTGLLRWVARRPDLSDGQSGMRAFSPAAAASAEVVHDYNYAQVLTLDLLGKGFAYAEVPVAYARRRTGRSYVRLPTYLRRVVPGVLAELRAPRTAPAPASGVPSPAEVTMPDAAGPDAAGTARNPYAISLEALEASAHVPVEQQTASLAGPPPPDLQGEDERSRVEMLRTAGYG